jgi:beta-lactamase class A
VTRPTHLDLSEALKEIDRRLRTPGSPRRVTLPFAPQANASLRPDPAQLQDQLKALADSWDGVVGVYVYDSAKQREVASVNKETVFSAASVMKAAILLYTYIQQPEIDATLDGWLQDMIVNSNNIAANNLLAADAGGNSATDAARGALALSQVLGNLGLQHTYIRAPYADDNYSTNYGIAIPAGPDQEGEPPFTTADPYLRTTPAEMSQVFVWIEECRQGSGPLLAQFAGALTPARCQEMSDRLAQTRDHEQLGVGLPDGTRFAHKGGWIDDMEGDVGAIQSPGGDYVVAVFVYRDAGRFDSGQALDLLASFGHLIYSYFNPVLAPE